MVRPGTNKRKHMLKEVDVLWQMIIKQVEKFQGKSKEKHAKAKGVLIFGFGDKDTEFITAGEVNVTAILGIIPEIVEKGILASKDDSRIYM